MRSVIQSPKSSLQLFSSATWGNCANYLGIIHSFLASPRAEHVRCLAGARRTDETTAQGIAQHPAGVSSQFRPAAAALHGVGGQGG